MHEHTVASLIELLESYPSSLVVRIETSDGDLPVGQLVQADNTLTFCTAQSEETMKFFVDTISDPGDVGQYVVGVSVNGEALRAGPTSYDFLVVELVVQKLYEQAEEAHIAYSYDKLDEFVSQVFDSCGGP